MMDLDDLDAMLEDSDPGGAPNKRNTDNGLSWNQLAKNKMGSLDKLSQDVESEDDFFNFGAPKSSGSKPRTAAGTTKNKPSVVDEWGDI